MAQPDIHDLQEATAWDADGEKLGEVSQVHLDARTGEPAFVTVGLGLFNTREHFIPFDAPGSTAATCTSPTPKTKSPMRLT
ncbi:PRC-barrel domain-containing protein [Arthrobacter sp. Bz4]|uniref:PRC-barrel domain-containing protein n=1 Tax=Arthrobacter sp. Bz4 TaxID=2171979 RepID=UPI001FAEFB0B|nr:PRC-barrel domain-containing protein [Arthrobacter sp. Bz4]